MLILNTVAIVLAGSVEANVDRNAEPAREEAIAEARTGCLHSFTFDPWPSDPRQALDALVVVPEHEPYALACVDPDPSVDRARFVDGLVAGMSLDDARCFAGAPAPIRVEHVHAPKFPSVTSRRSIHLVAHDRHDAREARLEPLRSSGWILERAAAPIAHELDVVMAAAQTCEEPALAANPGVRGEVALAFTIGGSGRATEIELLGPSRRELLQLRAHFRRGAELVLPAEARTCIAGAVRAARFSLPPGMTRVEVTAAVVAMLPAS